MCLGLVRLVVDLLYNKPYKKITTNPQLIEQVEFGLNTERSTSFAALDSHCRRRGGEFYNLLLAVVIYVI